MRTRGGAAGRGARGAWLCGFAGVRANRCFSQTTRVFATVSGFFCSLPRCPFLDAIDTVRVRLISIALLLYLRTPMRAPLAAAVPRLLALLLTFSLLAPPPAAAWG